MSKVRTSLPVGERVRIAFSGGLDTSVAVAWITVMSPGLGQGSSVAIELERMPIEMQ